MIGNLLDLNGPWRGFHSKLLNFQADLDARRVFQWASP